MFVYWYSIEAHFIKKTSEFLDGALEFHAE